MDKIKSFFKRGVFSLFACAVSSLGLAVAASAESSSSPLNGASQQILDQFSDAASDITPIILGILGAGLGIFVIFVGIKLGKKMFTTVSK